MFSQQPKKPIHVEDLGSDHSDNENFSDEYLSNDEPEVPKKPIQVEDLGSDQGDNGNVGNVAGNASDSELDLVLDVEDESSDTHDSYDEEEKDPLAKKIEEKNERFQTDVTHMIAWLTSDPKNRTWPSEQMTRVQKNAFRRKSKHYFFNEEKNMLYKYHNCSDNISK
jgi:hypothetical protein